MLKPSKRRNFYGAIAGLLIFFLLWRNLFSSRHYAPSATDSSSSSSEKDSALPGAGNKPNKAVPTQTKFWWDVPDKYPVETFRALPSGPASVPLGKVQAEFGHPENAEERTERIQRQDAIRDAFLTCWKTYKTKAWLSDEVTPVSGKPRNSFGGWGATLVDSLDTLWLMDLKDEFELAVDALDKKVSFNSTADTEINVFETNIRFLGGLISAYDLSKDKRLLKKAKEVGDMLYKAFDTPNRMPVTRWKWQGYADGSDAEERNASSSTLLAEIGSLNLEFTRLSIISHNPKYYDAVQNIAELMHEAQMDTKLPGLWPIAVNAKDLKWDAGEDYTLGGMADSTYEYLPKMVALLGDGESIYKDMWDRASQTVETELLFRPVIQDRTEVLFSGGAHYNTKARWTKVERSYMTGHLECFTGGMFGLGAKLLDDSHHLDVATKLSEGCVWAYKSCATGVMPETFTLAACSSKEKCPWDESKWHKSITATQGSPSPSSTIQDQNLPPGFARISDPRYILRPEAIESLFYMFRITGQKSWADKAWAMWTAIEELTHTETGAYSGVWTVNPKKGEETGKTDVMESFWMGETLKYLYLTFAEASLVSLDEWVFNTEAHPFKRLSGARDGLTV